MLQLDGQDVMGGTLVRSPDRLKDVFAVGAEEPRVQLVPAFEDAQRPWNVSMIEWGGEGIVLKDRRTNYRPGARSRSWWEAKHKLMLPVEILHCATELVRWGDWGQACVVAFAYRPADG